MKHEKQDWTERVSNEVRNLRRAEEQRLWIMSSAQIEYYKQREAGKDHAEALAVVVNKILDYLR